MKDDEQTPGSGEAPAVLGDSDGHDGELSFEQMLIDSDEGDEALARGNLVSVSKEEDEDMLSGELDMVEGPPISRKKVSPPESPSQARGTALERSTSEEGLVRAMKRSRSFSPKVAPSPIDVPFLREELWRVLREHGHDISWRDLVRELMQTGLFREQDLPKELLKDLLWEYAVQVGEAIALPASELRSTALSQQYLPWTCPYCRTENTQYPSICESCERSNPELYAQGQPAPQPGRRRLIYFVTGQAALQKQLSKAPQATCTIPEVDDIMVANQSHSNRLVATIEELVESTARRLETELVYKEQAGQAVTDTIQALRQLLEEPVAFNLVVDEPLDLCLEPGEDEPAGSEFEEAARRDGHLFESRTEPAFHASASAEPIVLGQMCQEMDHLEGLCGVCRDVVGLCFDPRMCAHRAFDDHPEQPARVTAIYRMLQEQGLVERCSRVPVRAATRDELCSVHTSRHIESMLELPFKSEEELEDQANTYNSIYLSQGSAMAAVLAAGGVSEVTRRVCEGEIQSAVAVVRPPGHHCERHEAMGFCLFGNVGIAAKQALTEWGLRRVLVLDWDVHHGNGTQKMFYHDNSVLFISLHRGFGFYPGGPEAEFTAKGEDAGEGYSLNIPWPRGGVGDAEYLRAFDRIVMPVAEEYDPELVLISAGFDAARGDPLGGCDLTPRGYFTMTRRLQGLAGGKVVVALEGGYNLVSISASMAACVRALLDDNESDLEVPPVLVADPVAVCDRGIDTMLTQIQCHFVQYWPSLAVRRLAEEVATAAVDAACIAVAGEKFDSLVFEAPSPEEVEWDQVDCFSSLSDDEAGSEANEMDFFGSPRPW